jgi:hypothetical protein
MDQPSYFPLTAEDTPVISSADGLITINVHSGELDGVRGRIPTFTPVNTYTATAKEGGSFFFNVPAKHNAFVYVLEGKVKIAGDEDEIESHYVVVMNNDGEGFEIEALDNARIMVGTGEPLNEPVVSHGPFVMNNQTQVMEAFKDYQLGKMGILIEE